jgi:uncharacterized protein (TIGR02453 family)
LPQRQVSREEDFVIQSSRFRPALFRFIADLQQNNDREWFKANRDRYEGDLRQPALAFVVAMGPVLRRISPHLEADPRSVGGSLFRIYRDIRFSKDKSPYKDHAGIQFRHETGRDAHAPGLYLHLQPRNCFIAAGIWQPDTTTARRIRTGIATDPQGWRAALRKLDRAGGWEQHGEHLKRPPRGFPPDHPLVEELKRKSWIAFASLKQSEVTQADFPALLGEKLKPARTYLGFLCEGLGLAF